jgi:hypothetical protein
LKSPNGLDSANLDLSDRIAAPALAHRLPGFSTIKNDAEFAGPMGYGISLRTLIKRASFLVKKDFGPPSN